MKVVFALRRRLRPWLIKVAKAILPQPIQRRIRARLKAKSGSASLPLSSPARSVLPSPLLSIIVPVYEVEAFIRETLASLRGQRWRNIEVILVDDGSKDGSVAIAEEFVQADRRFRLIHQENQGLGAARNAGGRLAKGKYIAFLDSDDIVYPGYYEDAIRTLEKTKSSFAIGSYTFLVDGKDVSPGKWIMDLHRMRRERATLDKTPDAMANVPVWTRVYLRSFYLDRVAPQPEGVHYEDQLPAVRAFARASAFDVLDRPAIHWRRRATQDSISQQIGRVDNLRSRVAAYDSALDFLRQAGREEARTERILQILATDQLTLGQIEGGNEEYMKLAADFLRRATSSISRSFYLDRVPAQDKVLHHLIMNGLQDEAMAFLTVKGRNFLEWVLEADGANGLIGRLPAWAGGNRLNIPAELSRPTLSQASPENVVDDIHWEGGDLCVSGAAYLSGIHDPGAAIEAWLVCPEVEQPVPVSVTRTTSMSIAELTSHRYLDYANMGFRCCIPVSGLVEALTASGKQAATWGLQLEVRAGGLVRHSRVKSCWGQEGDGLFRELWLPDMGLSLEAGYVRNRGVVIKATHRPDRLYVTKVVVTGQLAELVLAGPEQLGAVASCVKIGGQTLDVDRARTEALTLTLDESLAEIHEPTPLQILSEGSVYPVHSTGFLVAGGEAEYGWFLRFGSSEVRWLGGDWNIGFDNLEVGDDRIRLILRCRSPRISRVEVRLYSAQDEMIGQGVADPSGRIAVDLNPRREAELGWAQPLVRAGLFNLTVTVAEGDLAGRLLTVRTTDDCESRLPIRQAGTDRLRVTISRLPKTRGVKINIGCRGVKRPFVARVRRDFEHNYGRRWTALKKQVYLQCLAGDEINDTQLVLAKRLTARGYGDQVVWGVESGSVAAPQENKSVIIGTPDYYKALATSAVLCFNHEVPLFLADRDDQLVIETYHGHPFKYMGVPWWRRQGQTELRMKLNLDWRQHWDVLLTPSPLATKLYRECMPVRAEAWELGAPRNDVLADPPAGRREKIRAKLGIADSQTAILFAPTWRSYATSDPWNAPMISFVEPSWLTEQLGENYVLIIRGHPSNRRASWSASADDQIVDATRWHDVNDLILASDIGLFDYSSIRFDYTVTGKPMVFFVPDKERFFEATPGLWPYDESVAGRQVVDAAELPDALRSAGAERDSLWAEAYETLRQRVAPYDDGKAGERFADRVLDRIDL
jgi:CDP-glycerol glycerophosphotransferase